MEFFNKKEEVIDLKLTQFGRYLLSRGKLSPAYYSFFDDNVLYNVERAGTEEFQSVSEDRIKNTPTMHHQVSYSSLEKEFNNNYNKILSGESTEGSVDIQRTAEKHYSLPQPIGASDVDSNYVPAWSIEFLNGAISGSVQHLNLSEKTGGKNTQVLPQLSCEVKIKLEEKGTEGAEYDEFEEGFPNSNFVLTSKQEDTYVLLKVSENNGLFQKENFDIEIFEIEEEDQDGTKIETLRQVEFSAPLGSLDPGNSMPEEDISHVEYYFDILVDSEIDDELLCTLDPEQQKKEKLGVFTDPRTKVCQDIINQKKKKVFDIYSDEADNPGEIC